jgi:hypothetical protein
MNPIELIANVLTKIDVELQNPALIQNDAKWQQLWALRKHLDDQQRELVASQIAQGTDSYQQIANKLNQKNGELSATIKDIGKIDATIQTVAGICSLVAGLLKA